MIGGFSFIPERDQRYTAHFTARNVEVLFLQQYHEEVMDN